MKLIHLYFIIALSVPVSVMGWIQEKEGAKEKSPEIKKESKKEKSGKSKEKMELFTEIFIVPPSCFGPPPSDSGGAADPFAAPKNANLRRKLQVKKALEGAGIQFSEGTSAIYNPLTNALTVRNTEEQLELIAAFVESIGSGPERQIHTIVEYIETDSARFYDWMFDNRITTDGTPLRNQAQKWVKENKATIIETVILTARSGQRAKTEAIHEVIYPTEWDPAEIPNDLTLSGKDSISPVTASGATAFETRNTGTTFEVDPVLGADEITIDLNLAPEIVQQKGIQNWSSAGDDSLTIVSMPTFHKLKVTTQVTTLHRRYAFLGAAPPLKAAGPGRKKPIVLVFARGDVAETPEEPKKRIRISKK